MTPRGGRAHQVADMLGLTARSFQARRARLEAVHGFPQPLPGLGNVWDLAAIERWIAQQGGGQGQPSDELMAAEAELVRRARATGAVA